MSGCGVGRFSPLAHRVACYLSRLTDPYINLALEDWLFRTKSRGSCVLFLYRNGPSVVIGRNQNPWRECNLRLTKDSHIPLVRRKSGGGTVYHDLGNTNYSIMTPRSDFDRSRGVQLITRALHNLDIPASENARHDILVNNHSDLVLLKRYLANDSFSGSKSTQRQIQGRGVESVASPVTSLAEHSAAVSHLGFVEAVVDEFVKTYARPGVGWFGLDYEQDRGSRSGNQSSSIQLQVLDDAFVEEKENVMETAESFKTWDWTFGQTPRFTHTLAPLRLLNGQTVEATFCVEDGRIQHAKIATHHDPVDASAFQGCRYDASSLELVSLFPGMDENRTEFMDWFRREIT
ncbi:lipoyl(octanoyl) transferase [Synchytrium endobioticum]|uniref:Putative lipoate-protein ligase A n=1 Tax=Synchytrium endobioticum TaxID=286115 RepID=A0A507DMG4_9FUNG|nr:lipoyl(octanoyl) transferase [Synchytrium endobioticum]